MKAIKSSPTHLLRLFAVAIALITLRSAGAQDAGTIDTAFAAGNPPDNAVYALAAHGEKVVVGGEFSKMGTTKRVRIALLSRDGALETTFDPKEGFNAWVAALAVQGDGKILAGGAFSTFDNITARYIARLNDDGTLDNTFVDPGLNSYVYSIIPLPNGDMLVGGAFSAIGASSARQYLVRLKSNGTVDPTFTPVLNNQVLSVALQPDGRIMIGGDFTSVGGQPRNRIARLNANGSLDTTFEPAAGPNGTVRTIIILQDSKVLLGGNFTAVNGAPAPYFARLLPTGLPDFEFQASLNGQVYKAVQQQDGRIIIAGDFTRRLDRLRANGAQDASFNVGAGGNTTVSALLLQPSGHVIGGGSFVQWNGADQKYLLRLTGSRLAEGGQFDFSSSSYVANETQTSLTIEVRRSGNTGSAVSVDFATSNGTATAGDYVPKTETLNFAAGETRKTVQITIRPDPTVEDDETFNVTLSNPTGGAELGVESSAVVRLVSDDVPTTAGSIDTAFGAGTLANVFHVIAIDSEGKIVVGGDFRGIARQSRFSIARLEESGLPDPTFYPGTYVEGIVHTIAAQDDGKLLIGGNFGNVSGVPRQYIARLNRDGVLDSGFMTGSGFNSYVYAIVPLTFGDSLVGGSFTSYNGTPTRYLTKLFGDGSMDTTFEPQFDGPVYAIVQLPNGKFMVGGEFQSIGGIRRPRIARLNQDGTLDPTFETGAGPDGPVNEVAVHPDGSVYIAGNFGTVNRGPWRYLARLSPNGSPDTTFSASLSGQVFALVLQPDGRILLGGDFTGRFTRLLSDGSPDPTMNLASLIADNSVHGIALQADGRVIAGGLFKKFGSFNRDGLVRLQGMSAAPGGEFEFTSTRYTVSESQPSITIEVRRVGAATEAASVALATTPEVATAGDFSPQSTRLSFAANETRKTVNIPIRADVLVEEDETFSVALSAPSPGAELGSIRTARVVITNDDYSAEPGAVDPGFGGQTAGASIYAISPTPDGKNLIAGDFTIMAGKSRVAVTRLLPSGLVDDSFSPAIWLDGAVFSTFLQEDGKVVLGGTFSQVSGFPRRYFARLHADGTVDASFSTGAGPDSYVYGILGLPNDALLVAGTFSQYNGDTSRKGLVKLFSDGSLDTTFNPGINLYVYAIAIQPDGKIVIGGDFAQVGGQPRIRIARLNADGSLDTSFRPGAGIDGIVRSIVIQPDNKILIGGSFGTVNGVSQRYLARLHPDGSLDSDFAPNVDGQIFSIALQLDGSIVAGGDFTGRLRRFKPSGATDPSMNVSPGANSTIFAISVQQDGAILAGGNFSQFNGLNRPLLARVQGLSDSTGGSIAFAVSTVKVPEQQASLVVEVLRGGSTDTAVTVDFATVTGTATAGDYTPQNGTLIFGAGESRKNITLSLKPDSLPEDAETFTITLTNPSGGAVLGPNSMLGIEIADDDLFSNPGAPDLSLRGGKTLGNYAHSLAVTPEGKIVVGGDFRMILGQNAFNIARLNPDGTLDQTFDHSVFFDNPVLVVRVQSDSKIVLGGIFTTVYGQSRRYVARLNPNGTVDSSFNPGVGANSYIYALETLPGGDMVAGGTFTTYNNEPQTGLVKLFTDGSRDRTFNPQLNQYVYAIAFQPDGKILIGGDFTTVGAVTRNRLARLNADGSLDTTFDSAAGPNSTVGSPGTELEFAL